MGWVILIGAGLLEIVWAVMLKFADGFTRFWPSAIGLAAAMTSFVMLSVALKSLPVGTAYAVWVASLNDPEWTDIYGRPLKAHGWSGSCLQRSFGNASA